MSEIVGSDPVDDLCKRLADMQEVFLPVKHSDGSIPTISADQKQSSEESTDKSVSLKNYFVKNPLNFLRRYHRHIKPREIHCFNDMSDNVEIAYYIRKICQNENLASRTEMNSQYMSNQVKNRRYKALQRMINEGDYFSEESMKKRCPYLYDHYIGRFLTDEEREEKLREKSSAHPSNLSEFFMDVIEQKQECEELRSDEEEFEEEEEEDEDEQQPAVPMMEKAYLVEEFKSRMYQRFLDGFDKHFQYDTVDSNPEYDDDTQIERDAEDNYFDDEEPGNEVQEETKANHNDSESEDELDAYMRRLENDSSGNAKKEGDRNGEKL